MNGVIESHDEKVGGQTQDTIAITEGLKIIDKQ
jgi:hypothetical protein